jgi:hypothetical protein
MGGTITIWVAVWFVVSVAFGMLLGKFIYGREAEPIPVVSDRRNTLSDASSPR